MIVYYDESGNRQPLLSYKDLHIKHMIDGDDELSFILPTNAPEYKHIGEETQIDTDDNEWIVKKIDDNKFDCELNFDFLKTRAYKSVLEETKPLAYILEKYLPDGWNVEGAGIIGISRTIELDCVTDYDVIYSCMKTYSCYFIWKIKEQKLHVFSQEPEGLPNSGEYITKNLNLKELSFKGESTDFATRIYAYGADGLTLENATVNGNRYGLEYIDNNAYANKLVSYVWSDERYTDADSLYDAALKKLAEKSYPVRSYECSVIDLAKQNESFAFLRFKMHYKAILIDEDRGTRIEHKVVQYDEYPDEPARNKVTLAGTGGSIRSYVNGVVTGLEEEIEAAGTSLNHKILLATAYLLSAFGTYQYTDPVTGNVYLMDNEDYTKAESVWLFNKNGIGHSSTGINGPFTSAWTANDELIMSIINAMVIRGEYIEAGSIKTGQIAQSYTDGVVSQAVNIAEGKITAAISNAETGLRNEMSVTAEGLTADIENAVEGLQNQITVNAGQISTLLTDVSGLQTSISATAAGIAVVSSKVDNLKIGSRNLLIDSACFETRNVSHSKCTIESTGVSESESMLPSGKSKYFEIKASEAATNNYIQFKTNDVEKPPVNANSIKPSTEYVLSFYAKLESGTKTFNKDSFILPQNEATNKPVTINDYDNFNITITNEWKRFVCYFVTHNDQINIMRFRFETGLTQNETIKLYISSLQLEEGNIVTDWHKNDVDYATEFLKPNEFSSLLGSSIGSYLSNYVENSTLTSLTSHYDSEISNINNEIALKASRTDVATLTTTVNTINSNLGTLQNTVSEQATLITSHAASIKVMPTNILNTVSESYYLKSSATTLESNLKNYANGKAKDEGDIAYANAVSYIDQKASSIKLAVESEIEVYHTNLLFNSGCFKGITPVFLNCESKPTAYDRTPQNDYPSKADKRIVFHRKLTGDDNADAADDSLCDFVITHNDSSSKILDCNFSELKPSTATESNKYVFSFYAKASATINIYRPYLLRFTYNNNGNEENFNATIDEEKSDELSIGTSTKRYRIVFSLAHQPTGFSIRFYTNSLSYSKTSNFIIMFSSFKLERGTVATDWALSNQDVSALV